MKSLRNVLSKTLYSLLSTGLTWMDRKRHVMAAKMLAAKQNINTNKRNQLKITRDSSLIFAAVVCVYWYTGLHLVCYMKIFALNVNVVDEIF